jgi:methionine-gamma-lyase
MAKSKTKSRSASARPPAKATRLGDATLAIHAGEPKHGRNGPVAPPIARTSNFVFADTAEMKRWAEGKSKAYIYTRYGNPTLAVAEEKLAALESAEAAIVTSSGMAAISSALLAMLQSGDELIATRQLYGGAYRLLRDLLPSWGIRVHFVEPDLEGVDRLVNERTRALYVETPTNPTLMVVDLRKAAAIGKRHDIVTLVDNTFASPVLQKPISLGIDLVAHSATKYLGGHSDLIAGVVAGPRKWIAKVRERVIYLGGSLDPGAAYLLIRGLKTLEIRVLRQCATAMAVARYLERHHKVARVHYPGLASHPSHRLARRQMSGFGGMLAFELKGGLPAARRFCDRARIFLLAASLGGVESLIVLPEYTSHYKMSANELAAAGIGPGAVRVSVGLEDPADLIADLKQALA